MTPPSPLPPQDCKTSGANAIARAGAAGYFAPTPCSKFYGFTWWITVYLLILVFILPILMSVNGIRRFRAGLVGLVAIETMLLMDMINSFLYFNTIPTVSGGLWGRGVGWWGNAHLTCVAGCGNDKSPPTLYHLAFARALTPLKLMSLVPSPLPSPQAPCCRADG